MHEIRIDRSKPLSEDPSTGHNRFHPDIEPLIIVDEGQEVLLETRDAVDGQLKPNATVSDFANLNLGSLHPVTGPVYVKGVKAGDVLEIEFVDIIPQSTGFTCIIPGLGFLRDIMKDPFITHWNIEGGWATSDQIPGVRIPGAPFMGICAVAPSHQKVAEWTAREEKVVAQGYMAMLPDPTGAVPASGSCAIHGLRTLPPRENGGNFDVKQLTPGSKLFLPVFVDGGLFSTGDGHFAQGDGEVCVNAIEMGASVIVRFKRHPGLGHKRKFQAPVFTFPSAPKKHIENQGNILGVMGLPIDNNGEIAAESLNMAARNAILNMMELLQERGYDRNQAYVICSVAADLHISNAVDLPNYVVSALLPEFIFQ